HFTETNHDANNVSGGDLVDARDSSGVLNAFSLVYGEEIGGRASGRSELVGTWFVNTAFFDVFGVKPVAGRTFRDDDVQKAAVISHGYAIDHYGSGAAALGKVLSIDTRPYEVVGVMPPGFHFPQRAEVWVTEPPQPTNTNRTGHNYPIVARLEPGLPLETARATMATLSRRISTDHPDTNGKKSMVIVPLQERMVGNMRSTLYLLLGAVGVLFLIACANVANLLLPRAPVRTRESAR